MSRTNGQVFVQEANKPKTRKLIGYLSFGHQPDEDDWARWEIDIDRVMEARWCKRQGEKVFLVVLS